MVVRRISPNVYQIRFDHFQKEMEKSARNLQDRRVEMRRSIELESYFDQFQIEMEQTMKDLQRRNLEIQQAMQHLESESSTPKQPSLLEQFLNSQCKVRTTQRALEDDQDFCSIVSSGSNLSQTSSYVSKTSDYVSKLPPHVRKSRVGRAVSAQLKKGDPAALLPLAVRRSRFGQALRQVSVVSEGTSDSLAKYLNTEQRVSCKGSIFENAHDDDTQLSTHVPMKSCATTVALYKKVYRSRFGQSLSSGKIVIPSNVQRSRVGMVIKRQISAIAIV